MYCVPQKVPIRRLQLKVNLHFRTFCATIVTAPSALLRKLWSVVQFKFKWQTLNTAVEMCEMV